jgi:hypothetical protein
MDTGEGVEPRGPVKGRSLNKGLGLHPDFLTSQMFTEHI